MSKAVKKDVIEVRNTIKNKDEEMEVSINLPKGIFNLCVFLTIIMIYLDNDKNP